MPTGASVYGGIPCQPIAPSGAARGVNDPRSGDTTDALSRASRALDANSTVAENHASIIVTMNGGGYATLGYGAIPRAKQSRAISMLSERHQRERSK